MSGMVIGIGGLLAGCLQGIGSIAIGAGEVAVKGGIATYEQFQIANECSKAIAINKTEMKNSLNKYNCRSNAVSENLTKGEEREVKRLYDSLVLKGVSRQMLNVQGTVQEKLIKLMAIDMMTSSVSANTTRTVTTKKNSSIRTPREIYNSISNIANPLLATMFVASKAHKEIETMLDKAEKISLSPAINATEKSTQLKAIETELLAKLETYKEISRNHEYLKGQYIGVTTALKKLAEYCGEAVTIPEFNSKDAKSQIREIQAQCGILREKASRISKEDAEIIEVNKIMASIVAKSIEATGNKVIKIEEKPYGTESYHSFGSSVLKATTTNEGVISLNLLGKTNESESQLKFDERRFCQKELRKIVEALNNNGVAFDTKETVDIDENNIVRIDIDDFEDDSESFFSNTINNQVMYADDTGGY